MFQREAISHLTEWYNSNITRKPLLLRGARQVGKTTLVRMLAKRLNLQLVEINLEKPWSFTKTFISLNPRQVIEAMEFELNIDIDPQNSLVFFDEVQACPTVLPLLRYFYEETPEYGIIATGPLLEFALAEPEFSIPVGRLELYHLGPLSFQEFLHVNGETKALKAIEKYQIGDEITDTVHEKLNALVRVFCIVGGMPEPVSIFKKSKNFREVEKTKSQIIETFRLDFHKYPKKSSPQLLRLVYDTLPNFLGRKLVYSKISSDYKSKELSAAVQQLCLAGIISKTYHSQANGVPLSAEKKETFFKLLLLDAGLLLSQLRLLPSEFNQVQELDLVNKGALAEQFIGQHLKYLQPAYRSPELYYWCRENPSASAEVDYLIESIHGIVPVEVKAGKTGKLKSLQIMVKEKSLPLAVRFCTAKPQINKEVRGTALGPVEFTLVSLPHYLVQQISRLVVTKIS